MQPIVKETPGPGCSRHDEANRGRITQEFFIGFEALQTVNCINFFYTVSPLTKGKTPTRFISGEVKDR